MNESYSEITGYYKEQYEKHQVHSYLDKILEDVHNNSPENILDADLESRAVHFRLIEILTWTKALLSKYDPIFIHKKNLDPLISILTIIKQNWDIFKEDPTQWTQLEQSLPSLLDNLHLIEKNDIDTEKLSTLYEEYYQRCVALKRYATMAEQDLYSVRQKLNALENDIDKQKTSLDAIATNHTEKFTSSQTQRAEDFSKTQEERKTSFDEFVETADSVINNRLNDLDNKFGEYRNHYEKDASFLLGKFEKQFTGLYDENLEKASKILDAIQNKLDEATKVVGTIATTALAGNYKKIAQREFISAWIMRGAALFSFGWMIWILYTLVDHLAQNNPVDWAVSIIRLILGLVLIGPATYCAKESSRHWKLEKEYRKMNLELSAIKPYLDSIEDPEKKKELLVEKAHAYFGANQVMPEDRKNEMENTRLSLSTLVDLFKQIAESFSK